MQVEVTGKSQKLAPDQTIWVVTRIEGSNRYYPHDGPVAVQHDGDWTSAVIFIGNEDDSGKDVHVLAVVANKEASTAFENYLTRGAKVNDYPGYEELPKGAEEYFRVSVVRE